MADLAPPRPRPRPTRLGDMVDVPGDTQVSGVCLDSRFVRPGDLFVALPGASAHGARFVGAAVGNGAAAVLTDAAGALVAGEAGVPVVVVADPRSAMARLAAAVYGHPAEGLRMFGLTGTNGKTSTMVLLAAALAAVGETVGTIGTLGFRVDRRELAAARSTITTPESPDLHALLAVMAEQGATSVAMEVSSHALALDRVAGITFEVSGFTQLGRDHLDFHHDLEAYFAAKCRLFLGGASRTCVVNVDDPWGRRLAGLIEREGRARLLTTGRDAAADYRLLSAGVAPDGGSLVELATPAGVLGFGVGLLGEFNVRNAVTAAAMVGAAGLPLERAVGGFATARVPGRMQRVDLGPGAPRVVVDFAHTPEAVAAALDALPPGHRIAVLGAGGDRDRDKRGPMGAAAAAHADVVVVTDDNPRSEPPEEIRAAVLAGARRVAGAGGVRVLDGGDRRTALRLALALAAEADWIAVLGKGHERGQEIAGTITPFDDVAVVGEEWARLALERSPRDA